LRPFNGQYFDCETHSAKPLVTACRDRCYAAAHPEDAFKKKFDETARARAVKAAGEAAFSLEVLQDLQGLMDVGIRVNHDLIRLWTGS
jgi:hypothetical protein